ncbi:tubulin-like doman-containing protein [Polyangium aurulentum]|uniref:tubulin-like doman-containing protein n=1 Tax=Polyangium aurulentum TaxID=2567896 RepID=UPI0010AE21A4|nr:tubulin-like doman-containing protein [Polyangium aurulentum]UQA59047.1 tubulin-like doman-containing protein [Polyangium aurulentum]
MTLSEKKIAPAFFIGLGGAGGAIVDELARKVKQDDAFERYNDLVHFFAFDTDADDLARLVWVDAAHKFVLSDFDKPEYVELKQGKLHAKADPLFTQWWPEWYRPRAQRGKGAGQIRIESRLSLYHHLENDRAKIVSTLEKAIRRAYDVHNPFRANKAAKIHVYASLAGGTGSGGFVTMALTLRRLLGGQRGHRMIGTFVLPNVFRGKGLPPNQFDKIMANGYAALQELELLQSASPAAPVVFHYDPDNPERVTVDRPPFDQIYLVEEKTDAGVVIADSQEIYPAIADAAHAQIFTSILDREGSTLDNDTRELMQLDEQAFTKSFGSFGISAMVLPVEDLLEYGALRLGSELLLAAVPGGSAALGDGADLDAADDAFVRGLDAKAAGRAEEGEPYRRAVEWARGGGAGGEGAIGAFVRRCREDVLRRVDEAIKLRGWDDAELAAFERDPERVRSETAQAFAALKTQLGKSEDGARDRAREAAARVAADTGDLSLTELAKGKGPTEARYFHALLRGAIAAEQEETRKAYERGLVLADGRLVEDLKRRVEELAEAAPETLLEKLPGRENDYFEVASTFAAWYRDMLDGLRARVRANAMLEFYAAVLKELDRRRLSSFHFFARVDRIQRRLEERAARLVSSGGRRQEGSDANRYVLDVEVLQDHRSGKRLWEHLYARIVRPSDLQLSGALSRLAAVASGGGAEQDIERRIIDDLVQLAAAALRGRIAGSEAERGLRIDEELAFEASIVSAARRLERRLGTLPPTSDPAWLEEAQRTPEDEIASYIKDKLEHASVKCAPFVTLGAGAPLLPDKAYAVMHHDYERSLGPVLAHLASHRVDRGQIVPSERPGEVIFYLARLGCPLHAVKSLSDYERRYRAVKDKELSEGAKVPGLPKGVPQIPIHIDKNWEGAPDPDTRLFRISIDGVKEGDSKISWAERIEKVRDERGEHQDENDDLRDFTLAIAFGLIRRADSGYLLDDPDLPEDRRKLGKFRDQAFAGYRGRIEAQKVWVRRGWLARLVALEEERDVARLRAICEEHVTELERLVKVADGVGGKPELEHLGRELSHFAAFRKEKGL